MSHRNRIFHLSIPCADLGSAEDFYVGVLGCHSARRYADRITLDFFGDQVVCHLSPGDVEEAPSPYPRHFGLTFRERSDFDDLVSRLTAHEVPLLEPPGIRFAGMPEEHLTVFVADPSNNVLEFKHYLDPAMMY